MAAGRQQLSVLVPPSLASLRLMPRLSEFLVAFPDIEVNVETRVHGSDHDRTLPDLEVRYGTGRWAGIKPEILVREALVPLCSPRLARTIKTADDLRRHTLIDTVSRNVGWREWAARPGSPDLRTAQRMTIDHSPLALQAAVEGIGVALESSILGADMLRAGLLTEPLAHRWRLRQSDAYWLIYLRADSRSRTVLAFVGWLRDVLASR